MVKHIAWRATSGFPVYAYRGQGQCFQKVIAPVLPYTEIDEPSEHGDAFTLIVAWGFGFDGQGAKPEVESPSAVKTWLSELRNTKYGQKIYSAYEKAPKAGKELLEIAVKAIGIGRAGVVRPRGALGGDPGGGL